MRSKRTDRRELKRALARLEAENAALRTRLSAADVTQAADPAPPPGPSAVPAPDKPPAPALAAGGYPTRAAPLQAKSLKEAKEILMNSTDW